MTTMHADIPLPPMTLRFMREDDSRYLQTGDELAQLVQRAPSFFPGCRILDLGCGYGRLAHALLRSPIWSGRYLGVDILPKHIAWSTENLERRGKDVQFVHLDIRNDRYNPEGTLETSQIGNHINTREHFDVVCLFSVFTHMYSNDIRNYLTFIRTVTAQSNNLICTFFLLNNSQSAAEAAGKSGLPMRFDIDENSRYYNREDTLHAIGYKESFIRQLMMENGFVISSILLGSWCGRQLPPGQQRPYQDVVYAEMKA